MRFLKCLPVVLAASFFACGEEVKPDPIPNPTLSIVTTSLPAAQLGVAYSARVEATGGSASGYQWAITANTLPEGLTIAADGTPNTTISGSPSESGTIGFTVEVTDSAGAIAKKDLTIGVNEGLRPVAIETTTLPAANEGEAYRATIAARDGTGEGYLWTITDGRLPLGLALSPNGTPETTITGTPAESGELAFTIRVNDSASNRDDQSFTLNVLPFVPPPLAIETMTLPDGIASIPYSQLVTASGGSGTGYTWSIARGGLPGGLTLDAEGTPSATLSGTPRLDDNFTFTIQVTDSLGATAEHDFAITIAAAPPVLDVIVRPLPNALEDQNYAAAVRATGGSEMDYAWSISGGTLPPGLTMGSTGTPAALISGVPTAEGVYTFSVTVRDSLGNQDEAQLSIEVEPLIIPIEISTLVVPTGAFGVAYEAIILTVPGTGTGAGYNWVVTSGALPPGLTLEQNGTPSTRIIGTPTAGGDYTATITVVDSNNDTDSQVYDFDIFVPLNIVTTSLPTGQQNSPYSATISAAGGSESNYTWSIVQGALPDGLTLTNAGTPSTTLIGTPTVFGMFDFTVEARDDQGGIATRALSLSLVAGLTVSVAPMPSGTLGLPYSAMIGAVGGTAAGYSWSIAAGSLPPGLTLATMGTPNTTISGTPTGFGAFNFTVRVMDSGGGSADGDFSIEVVTNDRWIALIGDVRVDAINEIFIAGLPGLAPTTPVIVHPIITGGAAATTEVHTRFSPDGTKLAFRGDFQTDGINELWVVDISGNVPGLAQVVNGPIVALGGVVDFVWSPDSTRLIYSAEQDTDTVVELYLAEVSGATLPVKLNGTMVSLGDISPADFNWSPDGSTVAYLADQFVDGVLELFVVDVGGAVPGPAFRANNPLPSATDVNTRWVWTPGGDRLIYQAPQVTATAIEIFIVDITGGMPSLPVQLNGALVSGGNVGIAATDVAVSADGVWVAYVADQDIDAVEEVYVVDISGAVPGPSIKVSGTASSFTDNINLNWSPVASRLVYSSDQETTSVYEVYLVDVTGPAPSPALKIHPTFPVFGRLAAGAEALQWSADGTKVAYRADTAVDNAFEVEVVDVSGPTPGTPIDAMPPRVANQTTDAFEFAPDSSAIGARGEGSVDNMDELFVTRFSGPNANTPISVTGIAPTPGGAVLEFLWVGDSRHVLVRADFGADTVNDAYLIDTTAPVFPPVSLNQPQPLPANGDVAAIIVRPR